uniref:DUF2921 domain-containing protein n=1 Tax=Quercus lobata TaxID=97700 RepID=A0A7N2LJ48_QUELO
MVGSGKSYVGSFSSKYPDVVLKLNYSKNNSIYESGGDINLSPSKLDRGVCSVFNGQTSDYDLHYWSDCGSVNCNPLRESIEYLPSRFAYRGVRCDQRSRKVQLLLGFHRFIAKESEFPSPNATLIAEGAWDEKENKFCVISLRNSSSIVGEIWSKKDVKDSGYFGRIGFQSWGRPIDPQGLRYEYTEIEAVRNSCAQGVEIVRGKGKTYPDGFSLDMGFGMSVRNTEGKVTSGFSRPQFVGDVLYVHQDELKRIYDRDIGLLCMIGCRYLDFESLGRNSIKNGSLDCETRINIQFPPLHAEKAEIAKGTIESRRSKSDPLYFERLQLSSNSMTTTQAKESIRTVNLGITMVVICFGGLLLAHDIDIKGIGFHRLPQRYGHCTFFRFLSIAPQ